MFNIRTEKSIFTKEIFSNKYLIGAFLLGLALQVSVVAIPSLAKVFEFKMLNSNQWLYVIVVSFISIIIMEVQKLLNKAKLPQEYEQRNLNKPISFKALSK